MFKDENAPHDSDGLNFSLLATNTKEAEPAAGDSNFTLQEFYELMGDDKHSLPPTVLGNMSLHDVGKQVLENNRRRKRKRNPHGDGTSTENRGENDKMLDSSNTAGQEGDGDADQIRPWKSQRRVTKPWSTLETARFYDALSRFGTDFVIISVLFPGRPREEIRKKFAYEQRHNPEHVAAAVEATTDAKDFKTSEIDNYLNEWQKIQQQQRGELPPPQNEEELLKQIAGMKGISESFSRTGGGGERSSYSTQERARSQGEHTNEQVDTATGLNIGKEEFFEKRKENEEEGNDFLFDAFHSLTEEAPLLEYASGQPNKRKIDKASSSGRGSEKKILSKGPEKKKNQLEKKENRETKTFAHDDSFNL